MSIPVWHAGEWRTTAVECVVGRCVKCVAMWTAVDVDDASVIAEDCADEISWLALDRLQPQYEDQVDVEMS